MILPANNKIVPKRPEITGKSLFVRKIPVFDKYRAESVDARISNTIYFAALRS